MSVSLLPSSPLMCSLLIFQRVRAHRDLHSFPTRRSSDLCDVIKRLDDLVAVRARHGAVAEAHACGVGALQVFPLMTELRSEEHTSELQSRLQLVCRLLLEKKKQRTTVSADAPPL